MAALATAGCVTAIKENEVRGALAGVGFAADDLRCLASRASRQLTVRQLRQLEAAARSMDQPVMEMPIGEALERLRAHVDPGTLRAVARLSAECARIRVERTRA